MFFVCESIFYPYLKLHIIIFSGPNATKTMLPKNKVPGDMNSKFSVIEPRNGGGRTEFLAFEDYVEGSTHIGSLDKR